MSQQKAISATVTGDDQKVGFRAMVMKQAIEYNLPGVAAVIRCTADPAKADKTDPEQVVPGDAVRGDVQAGFRASGSVH